MKHIKLNGYLTTCFVSVENLLVSVFDNLIKKARDLNMAKGGILLRSIYFTEVFYMKMKFYNDLDPVCDNMLFCMTVHVKNVLHLFA